MRSFFRVCCLFFFGSHLTHTRQCFVLLFTSRYLSACHTRSTPPYSSPTGRSAMRASSGRAMPLTLRGSCALISQYPLSLLLVTRRIWALSVPDFPNSLHQPCVSNPTRRSPALGDSAMWLPASFRRLSFAPRRLPLPTYILSTLLRGLALVPFTKAIDPAVLAATRICAVTFLTCSGRDFQNLPWFTCGVCVCRTQPTQNKVCAKTLQWPNLRVRKRAGETDLLFSSFFLFSSSSSNTHRSRAVRALANAHIVWRLPRRGPEVSDPCLLVFQC